MAQCPDKTCDAKFMHWHEKNNAVSRRAELCVCSQSFRSHLTVANQKKVDKILNNHLYGSDIVTPCYDPRKE